MAGQKRKVARSAARKVRDKWRAKQWYTVRAPRMFNGVAIAETLADETDKLMGRVAEATLQELTGDFSKMHVKLHFKVNAVKGTDCGTKYIGHVLTSDYVRRLTRRKHSKIDGVYDVRTRDGFTVRVKPMAITEKRAQSSQVAAIRKIAEDVCRARAGENDLPSFVKEIVNGELSSVIYKEARKIYPLKRVEIRRSELRAEPENAEEYVEVFVPKPVEEEEAPAEETTEEEAPEEEVVAEEETTEEEATEEEEEEAPAEEEAEEAATEEETEPAAEEASAEEELSEEERLG